MMNSERDECVLLDLKLWLERVCSVGVFSAQFPGCVGSKMSSSRSEVEFWLVLLLTLLYPPHSLAAMIITSSPASLASFSTSAASSSKLPHVAVSAVDGSDGKLGVAAVQGDGVWTYNVSSLPGSHWQS
jgi:hypothetical protein